MIKIGIADTEEENISLYKQIIKEKLKEAEIVGIVSDGNEAVDMVRDLKPHILIINVSVSGLNGVDTVRKIREFNRKIHVIMSSVYDSIDFAREAIALKVEDYIMQPINSIIMLNALEKVMELVNEEQMSRFGRITSESVCEDFYEYTDYSFIYSALFNCKPEEIKRYKEFMNLSDTGYIMSIIFASGGELNSINNNYDSRLLYKCIKETVSRSYNCVVGPKIMNQIVIYVSIDEEVDVIDSQKSMDLADRLVKALETNFGAEVNVGVGGIKSIKDIYASFDESRCCIRYKGNGKIVQVEDVAEVCVDVKEYSELVSKLLETIKFGKEEAIGIFTDILKALLPLTLDTKRNIILQILIIVCYEVRMIDINYMNYFQDIMVLEGDELNRWSLQKLEFVINAVKENRTSKKSNSVSAAIKYMEIHYREGVSLDEISKYIGISPQHFSKIFKDETGINYVDWLANLRISIAKRLLNEGEKTIKEICFLVGYNDPNYFSRIFKKVVGISPVKYAKEGIPQKE